MKLKSIYLFFLINIVFAACNGSISFGYDSIHDIKANPEKYREHNSAKIEGTIVASQSVLGYSIAQLRDANGDTIYFLTTKGANNGDKVSVSGHYASLAKFSLLNISGIIED